LVTRELWCIGDASEVIVDDQEEETGGHLEVLTRERIKMRMIVVLRM